MEKENHQHTPRAGEPGLWYHVGGLYGDDVWGPIRKVKIRVDSGPGRKPKPGVSWLLQNSNNPREKIRVKPCRNVSMSLEYQLPDPGGELLGPATTKRSRPGRPPPLRVRSKPPSPVSLAPPSTSSGPGGNQPKIGAFSQDTEPGDTRTGSVSGSEPGRLCACEGNQQRPGHVTTQAPPT